MTCSHLSGRNGGHLTAHNFLGFQKDVDEWGIFEAIKAVHIEAHVVDAITSIVKGAGIENGVDLVAGVRTVLFFTKEEQAEAYDEYEAAKAAGMNVASVEWLTESEVEEVRRPLPPFVSPHKMATADLWSPLSSGTHPGKYDMASQARHPLVRTRAERLTYSFLEVAHAHASVGGRISHGGRRWATMES
jgi:phage-related protein